MWRSTHAEDAMDIAEVAKVRVLPVDMEDADLDWYDFFSRAQKGYLDG